MAKNRSSLVEQPPPAESSEEYEDNNKEEEEEEEDEEESDSEEEDDEDQSDDDQPISTKKPDAVSQPKPTKKPHSDTESESGSETESDDDELPRAKQPPKPVASKVTEKSPLKKAPNAAATTTPLKRNAEVERDSKDSAKRAKKSDNGEKKEAGSGGVEESGGKKLFQRLWSEEDEIIILEGIIDFVAKRGDNPHSDMDSFHDFIKKSIHIDVSKSQLLEKMKRLKRKYENNSKRGKQGGERTTFSKAHEQRSYDLSKKVWGIDGVVTLLEQAKPNGGTAKKTNQRGAGKNLALLKGEELAFALPMEEDNGKVKVVSSEMEPEYVAARVVSDGVARVVSDGVVGIRDRMVEMHKAVSGAKIDEQFIKEGMQLLEPAKAAEFEKKWKNLQLEELELHRKRAELVSQHSKFILDAYKSKQ